MPVEYTLASIPKDVEGYHLLSLTCGYARLFDMLGPLGGKVGHWGDIVFVVNIVRVVVLWGYKGTFGVGLGKGGPLTMTTSWHAGPRCIMAGER